MADLTLEERVAALESSVAALEAEQEYELRFSGEQTDEAISNALKIHKGTAAVKITGSEAVKEIELGITGFVPSQVFLSVRGSFTPTPYYNICTAVRYANGKYFAVLCSGAAKGSSLSYLPTGTFNIDWIAME